MKTYALTGGIGMGKSTAARWLVSQGIPVLDTDDLAREVVRPGERGLEVLVEHFGPGILQKDGTLDRRKVAEIVFQDPAEKNFLENVLHPLIRQRWQAWRERLQKENAPLCVVVIPLLFETGAEVDFDSVVCLMSRPDLQMARLRARGMSEEEVRRRNAAQWSVEEKSKRSHYTVLNNGTEAELGQKLSQIFLTPQSS